MDKSPDAFRTISEVADWLDVPTHVLRFWESRFAQVKPVKRAGGRRYYRPTDMRLIGGIKKLLHEDGMTIRGVQKLLREEGVKHVAGYSQPLDHELPDTIDGTVEQVQAVPDHRDAPDGSGDDALPFLPSHDHERPATVAAPASIGEVAEVPEHDNTADVPEETADAEWERSAEQVDESERDQAEAPTEPQENGALVAFGSVRSREGGVLLDQAAPEPDPAETLADDTFDLVDEASLPDAPPPPAPIHSDAPNSDPDDESADHTAAPGVVAQLYMLDRYVLAGEVLRLEQVVATLRAVRDRSAP